MAWYHFSKGLLNTYYCKCPSLIKLSAEGLGLQRLRGCVHLAGLVDTLQSLRFSHLVGKTARKGIPGLKRTQRRHLRASGKGSGEWMQEDQEPGKGDSSRQTEQNREKLRGDRKPGTGGRAGTGEVARSWAPRS